MRSRALVACDRMARAKFAWPVPHRATYGKRDGELTRYGDDIRATSRSAIETARRAENGQPHYACHKTSLVARGFGRRGTTFGGGGTTTGAATRGLFFALAPSPHAASVPMPAIVARETRSPDRFMMAITSCFRAMARESASSAVLDRP